MNLPELKRLAEAARDAKGDNARWEALDALEAAANPQTILSLISRIEEMEGALEEAREFIDRYSDVRDGDYGGVEPNEAMQIVHAIDQALKTEGA